jgi:hypothetical protein
VSEVHIFERKKSGATGFIKVSGLSWGTQQGLPFPLPGTGLPETWEVALPAEDSGLWLRGLLPPAAWATTLAQELSYLTKLDDPASIPSPAGFGLWLKDDASVVGEHVR